MDAEKWCNEFQANVYGDYIAKRMNSKLMYEQAQRSLPGGDTRTVTFYKPFPTFIERGQGCRVYDVDGHEYLDFVNNYTSLIHGHAHPKVVEAVIDQIKKGSVYGAPVKAQHELGEIICERLPSAKRARFCNSGTEATAAAIRVARAYRMKHKILKMEGGYHGAQDTVQISIRPSLDKVGPLSSPYSVPEDWSIPPSVVGDCIIAPFNETEITKALIEKHKDELAGVILEPVQGASGQIPPVPGFLETIREVTLKHDIPLIFDEVISLRFAVGGAQGIYGVVPDITALGKIIGGGFPVGGIAGREDLMSLYSPLSSKHIVHSGTYNGNPITMVAGIATLNALTASEIDRINKLGSEMRNGFERILREVGIIGQVTGVGSLAQVHFTKEKIRGWRTAATGRVDIRSLLHLLLLDKGIFSATRCFYCVSTPMGETEIEKAIAALKNALLHLLPYIEIRAPELIAK
jgi:glutamate-1-semialdehyde 2,1-aminomutase